MAFYSACLLGYVFPVYLNGEIYPQFAITASPNRTVVVARINGKLRILWTKTDLVGGSTNIKFDDPTCRVEGVEATSQYTYGTVLFCSVGNLICWFQSVNQYKTYFSVLILFRRYLIRPAFEFHFAELIPYFCGQNVHILFVCHCLVDNSRGNPSKCC